MMKRFFFILAAVLGLSAATVSCGKDNNASGGEGGGDTSVKSAKVVVKLIAEFNYDYFKYANLKVKYTVEGQSTTVDLEKPGVNDRCRWSHTLPEFTQPTTQPIVFQIIAERNSTDFSDADLVEKEYKNEMYSYLRMNTNCVLGFRMQDYDAAGKALGNEYGLLTKTENKNQQGIVTDATGVGAELGWNRLVVKKDGSLVENDDDMSYYKKYITDLNQTIKYNIVLDPKEGLTAKSAIDE